MRMLLAFAILSSLSLSSMAQPTKAPVPTMTRLVANYSVFERSLIEACAQRDETAINKLVDGDFELRSMDHPGVPVPRSDWVDQCLKNSIATPHITEMAVHDFGEVRIVSYRLTGQEGSRQSQSSFVDVWKGIDTPVLMVRYVTIGNAEQIPHNPEHQHPTGR